MDINNKRKQDNKIFNEFEDYYKLEEKQNINNNSLEKK